MNRTLVIGGFVALVFAANSQAGYAFKSVTKAEGGGRSADAQNAVVQAQVEGDKARMEFAESKNPVMSKGSYILTQDAGKTMFMVKPSDKTYMKWDVEAMMGMAGAAMKKMGGFMQMDFSDPKIEKLADEAGEPILGYPTRHYKFRTTFTTTMTMMGHASSTTTVKDEDVWTTSKITDAGMGAWLRKAPPSMGNEQLDKLIKAEMSKIEGFPLRQIMVNTTTDPTGKTQTSKVTTEVTELKPVTVPDSEFVLPPDYKELTMDLGDGTKTDSEKGDQPALPAAFMKMMQKQK